MATSVTNNGKRLQAFDYIHAARLAGEQGRLFDVKLENGRITQLAALESNLNPKFSGAGFNAEGRLLLPSFCHAHVHLDKCFLLQDGQFAHHEISDGGFDEAMRITGEAKRRFEEKSISRRARRLVEESIAAGVTSMRVYVEVDEIVEMRALDVARKLKSMYADQCYLQICVFAQLALFAPHPPGTIRRHWFTKAAEYEEVEAIGSTPYVEENGSLSEENIKWTVDLALLHQKHLDFHLDYSLDANFESMIWCVLAMAEKWPELNPHKTICLGHCTKMTQLTDGEMASLKTVIVRNNLPVHFVGLPTSDLYMMGRPCEGAMDRGERLRGTLFVPQMIQDYGLDCVLAINNVGNAFTPYSSCDPLQLASMSMLIYQAATTADCELLYEAVSTRAKSAIGQHVYKSIWMIDPEGPADLVLFGDPEQRLPESSARVVYNIEPRRTVFYKGRIVAESDKSAQLFTT